MSDTILEIKPLAPLLLRDGRPFSGGSEESRAQSLPMPLPQTLAGFIRTQLGNQQNWNWHDEQELRRYLQDLHGIPVRSILVRDNKFMFPVPQNAVIEKAKKTCQIRKMYRAAPQQVEKDEGCNWPTDQDLYTISPIQSNDNNKTDAFYPVFLSETNQSFKSDDDPGYWSKEDIESWLLCKEKKIAPIKITGPTEEERTHVQIDSQTGTGIDGALFSVTYRHFESIDECTGDYHRWSIHVKTDVKECFASLGHLGGERRPVTLTDLGNKKRWPNIGEFSNIKEALLEPNNKQICFILTSPALFNDGWKPAWLEKDLGAHTPAGVGVLRGKAKLVGAAVGRRIPVSGWSIRENCPKKVRWAVPAGSVYFLEITEELSRKDRGKLLDAWMKSISDQQNDQRDGFGCALWGVW